MGVSLSQSATSPRQALKRALYQVSERLWAAAFALTRPLWPRTRHLRAWQPLGGGRVLIVAPHPDDEVLGCAGAATLHRAAGDEVTALIVTDGRASRAGGRSADAMAACRAAEAVAAAQALATALDHWALPENAWDSGQLVARLRQRLCGSQAPALVYAPGPVDYHPEHLRVAQALADALDPQSQRPIVRVYEVHVPLTPRLASLVAETRTVAPALRAARASYTSQVGSFRGWPRRRRYNQALSQAAQPELFWEMSPAAYRALLAAGNWQRRQQPSPFHGLRERPFADPLAYLTGWRERARLAAVVAAAERAARTRQT